jgi:lipid II:glycine glycyltransferase (peptidoglycan interpeptide bridge formation enzyme)
MRDIRQSKNYADYLRTQGWVIERINNINYFIKKFPILGSVLKIQRPKKIRYKDIKVLSEKYKAFQIIIEPDLASVVNSFSDIHDLLLHNGYKLSKSTYLPSKTIQIDLVQSKVEIYRNFSKDCKYSIRKGEGLKIESYNSPKKIKIFHEAWKKSVNFKRYVPSLESLLSLNRSFPQSKSLFLASHNKSGSIIGGAIFTISSHEVSNYITYYWQGFTNNEGRASLSQYSILYQGILWGKKMGCKIFDFEGIYDERFPNKSWLGFTHFKKQFGGKEVLYPGCYSRFRIYNLFRF